MFIPYLYREVCYDVRYMMNTYIPVPTPKDKLCINSIATITEIDGNKVLVSMKVDGCITSGYLDKKDLKHLDVKVGMKFRFKMFKDYKDRCYFQYSALKRKAQ